MMEEGLEQKGFAQIETEVAVSKLVQLNGRLMNRVNTNSNVNLKGDKEYEALKNLYFEVLQNTANVIEYNQSDFNIPTKPKDMIEKVFDFIMKVKRAGIHNVGKKKTILMPLEE